MSQPNPVDSELVYQWIANLCDTDERLVAMLELFERRSQLPGLGPLLWHAFGAVAGLLQEVIAIYPSVMVNEINPMQSQRVCAAIGLFQTIGSHPETGLLLLRSHLMSYLMPLLKMTPQTLAVEHVRLSVLGVVCGMLKLDSGEIVCFFLGTELMHLVLRHLELGSTMSKVLSGFILHRILEHDVGLKFACRYQARRLHLVHTLGRVVHQMTLEPEPSVFKHVVRICIRLADNLQGLGLLQRLMPQQLRNGHFCRIKLPGYEQAPADLAELNRKVGQAHDSNRKTGATENINSKTV
ncbi:uncharacterized protein Dwil_GK12164 [Drosophila willistoni]|uniref:CCR4-NOT transcription complex subunit 9 n=1 Tax=Drosophila willistoni TaxID=7260 RepID=B4N962_DROWI|nr:CCR4-NOT transcription complex subunit 9 [Drosophila willistoni]XP_046865346.1 CCR4-NOT transcription complex subunit 9 [Drosophila willistoni]EDW81609.1 uncharacterized protein Dwil_GK12164 [Drosophila willistoni]